MKDLVQNELRVGDVCYYLKHGSTQVRVAEVAILEINESGIICLVIDPNPTGLLCRGVSWSVNHKTKPLSPTNLILKGRLE